MDSPMTATLTLTEFLLARVAEDEADPGCEGYGEYLSCQRWSDRQVAECAAKRRIVERHQNSADTRGVGQHRDGKWTPYCEYDFASWPCPDIRDIVSIYAGHESFRTEWAL